MKFIIEVKDEQTKAVHQVLKGLQKAGVITCITPEKQESEGDAIQSRSTKIQVEKTAHDFIEQYRDLVD